MPVYFLDRAADDFTFRFKESLFVRRKALTRRVPLDQHDRNHTCDRRKNEDIDGGLGFGQHHCWEPAVAARESNWPVFCMERLLFVMDPGSGRSGLAAGRCPDVVDGILKPSL